MIISREINETNMCNLETIFVIRLFPYIMIIILVAQSILAMI